MSGDILSPVKPLTRMLWLTAFILFSATSTEAQRISGRLSITGSMTIGNDDPVVPTPIQSDWNKDYPKWLVFLTSKTASEKNKGKGRASIEGFAGYGELGAKASVTAPAHTKTGIHSTQMSSSAEVTSQFTDVFILIPKPGIEPPPLTAEVNVNNCLFDGTNSGGASASFVINALATDSAGITTPISFPTPYGKQLIRNLPISANEPPCFNGPMTFPIGTEIVVHAVFSVGANASNMTGGVASSSSQSFADYSHTAVLIVRPIDVDVVDIKWESGTDYSIIPSHSGRSQEPAPQLSQGAAAPPFEAVECFVFDDGYANMEGPTDAVFISGRTTNSEQGKACMPGGEFGHCHKWFGRCRTVSSGQHVKFQVFDDGYANATGREDAVYIPKSGNSACLPDASKDGTCRRWFGRATTEDGRGVECRLFLDGYLGMTEGSDAIYISAPIESEGLACIPRGKSEFGKCRRWFGKCSVQDAPPDLSVLTQYLLSKPAPVTVRAAPVRPPPVTKSN
jgi:hypothetical protein